MNCPRCGIPIPSGMSSCTNCGLAVSVMKVASPVKKNNTARTIIIVVSALLIGPIFIIAILAAILFPVFQKTRENARLAVCQSNVKQLGLGLILYTQDHKGKYPASAANFKAAVNAYVMEASLFHCPDDAVGAESYSFNAKLQGLSVENIASPSETVAIYEGKNGVIDFRHHGISVVGFSDGHIGIVRKEQVGSLRWLQ